MEKNKLEQIYRAYQEKFRGTEIVLGHGNVNSGIVLVGEAPGRQEVEQNMPFVGQAGKNLTRFLESIGYPREDLYITNAIKYRLAKFNEKTGRVVNRPATKDDIQNNIEYLSRELQALRPKWVVTLGNVPLQMVVGNHMKIGDWHGRPMDLKEASYSVFPLYHPASIIYNRALEEVYQDDLQKLKEALK